MFENMKAGWALGKVTREIVFNDKELLIYPVIAMLAGFVEFLALIAGFFFVYITGNNAYFNIPVLFVFYVLTTFTTTYITMAMLIGFRSYTSGKKIGMGEAFAQTAPYTKLIFEWALFYGVIITIIKVIESRLRGIVQLLFGAIISLALSIALFFVVPVILDEKVGPIQAMKLSEQTIIKNFGKAFGGVAYSELYSLIFILAGVALILLGAVALTVSFILGAIILCLGFVGAMFGAILGSTLSSIFRLVLYDYIKTGKLPQGYSKDMINAAIRTKRGQQAPSQIQ